MLWALFFFLHTAHAEEFVVRNRMNQPLTLHVIEKKECLVRIAELTNSEGTIKQAISALTGEQSPSPLSCLEDLTLSSHDQIAEIPVPPELQAIGMPANYPFEKINELGVLQDQERCAIPYEEGTAKFEAFKQQLRPACLTWFTGGEAKAVKARAEAAGVRMAKWMKESSERYRLASGVAQLLVPPPADHEKRKEELSRRLDCINRNEPGTAAFKEFEQRFNDGCAGIWQTKEQWDQASAELRALGEQEKAAHDEWTEQLGPGLQYVQQEILAGRTDPAKLAAIQARAACYNAKEPGSRAFAYENKRLTGECPNGITTSSELAELKSEAQKLFPHFAEGAALARKKYEAERAAFPGLRAAALRKKSAAYEDARFLAKLTHFLTHGGTLDQAEQFCADYESRQHDDAQLAQSGVPMFPFELARDWRNALAYGLTEGEFSSIRAYTRDFYTEINGAMRAGKALPPKLVHFRKVFDRALAQLPDYNATSVNRVDYFPAEVLKQYEEGAILRYDAYTSTSKAKDWLNNGKMDHKSVLYLAHGGKNIEDFSHYTDEEEILIRPGTRFKVLKKTSYPGAAAMFILGEVDEQGNLLAAPPEESK